MIYGRQSTALIVTVGPVLDADGVAVTDGVVGDFVASKNGANPAALNGSATLTHRNTGHYSLSLTTTDTNTVGTLEIIINDTVNACPIKEIQILEEVIYDALFAASANTFAGAAGSTKVSGLVLADSLTAIATNGIPAAALSTGAVEKILQSVSGTADAGSDASNIVDAERTEGQIDYWTGAVVVPTSGANIGIPRRISAFSAVGDVISVQPAWPNVIGVGDTYIILRTTFAEVKVNAMSAGSIGTSTFSAGAIIDSNVQKINDVTITGDGQPGTEFGV